MMSVHLSLNNKCSEEIHHAMSWQACLLVLPQRGPSHCENPCFLIMRFALVLQMVPLQGSWSLHKQLGLADSSATHAEATQHPDQL